MKRQTNELVKASSRATQISESLKEQSKKLGTEDFLRRMTLVNEGLESVAIDINRIMESHVSEDDWNRYSRGDKGVFLRKLLGLRSRAKLSRINGLYRENTTFRDYVNRYVAQFDGLILAARRSDHEGVVSAALMTSDAGKVYLVLRSALDRADPGEDEESAP